MGGKDNRRKVGSVEKTWINGQEPRIKDQRSGSNIRTKIRTLEPLVRGKDSRRKVENVQLRL